MTARLPLLVVVLTALLGAAAPAQAYRPMPVPTPVKVPDPAAGGWQLNGASTITRGALQLTPATEDQTGSAFYAKHLNLAAGPITVTYNATIAGGTGADGLAMIIGDPARGAVPTSLGDGGGALGFGGIPGHAVALSTFPNPAQTRGGYFGISDGAKTGEFQTLNWLTTTPLRLLQNVTRKVRVTITRTSIIGRVSFWRHGRRLPGHPGQTVLAQRVALPAQVLLGFSAATGALTNRHTVSNVRVSAYEWSTPPVSKGVKLQIHVRSSPKGPEIGFQVDCSFKNAWEAPCPAALRLKAEDFAAPPAIRPCTLIYGGPQVATIRGTVHGTPVNATVTRRDGCEIARWNKIVAPLLPVPAVL